MLSIETLKEYGADTDHGLMMCMGNDELYLAFVKEVTKDEHFQTLEEAINEGDLDKAFEAAHALKGVLANLALTPLLNVCAQMSDLLKVRTQMDYSELLEKLKEERERLIALFE